MLRRITPQIPQHHKIMNKKNSPSTFKGQRTSSSLAPSKVSMITHLRQEGVEALLFRQETALTGGYTRSLCSFFNPAMSCAPCKIFSFYFIRTQFRTMKKNNNPALPHLCLSITLQPNPPPKLGLDSNKHYRADTIKTKLTYRQRLEQR